MQVIIKMMIIREAGNNEIASFVSHSAILAFVSERIQYDGYIREAHGENIIDHVMIHDNQRNIIKEILSRS